MAASVQGMVNDVRAEIQGTKRAIAVGEITWRPVVLCNANRVTCTSMFKTDNTPHFMHRFNEAYTEEIREFVHCIINDTETPVTAEDARAASQVSIAVLLSSQEGRLIEIAQINRPISLGRGEQYLQNLIRISSDLGIKMLAFGSPASRMCPENVSFSDGYKWLVNLLQVGGELASENDMCIVVEEVNRGETNTITNMGQLLNFVSDVNSPVVGITADLYHMSKEDPDIIQALEEANGLIWHVHLSDTNRLAPGEGNLDFPGIISKLKELNYEKYLSLEVKPSLVVEQTLLKVNRLIRRIL